MSWTRFSQQLQKMCPGHAPAVAGLRSAVQAGEFNFNVTSFSRRWALLDARKTLRLSCFVLQPVQPYTSCQSLDNNRYRTIINQVVGLMHETILLAAQTLEKQLHWTLDT